MSAPHPTEDVLRELRLVGVSPDGSALLCASGGSEPEFSLTIDSELRAALAHPTKGDAPRQWEVTMTSQLRPREIQNRIRAGASVEQVAAAAGCAPEKVEPFAYPVLMERGRIADQARGSRPLAGAPIGSASATNASRTLEQIVVGTLADRGQTGPVEWDAFRDERGWTVTATWQAGRSENRAEWAYTAGLDGGSVTARNDMAADLVEPAPTFLRAVDDARREAPAARKPESAAEPRAKAAPVDALFDTVDAAAPTAEAEAGAETPAEVPAEQEKPRSAKRGGRPAMPSWEDVLLGTRAAEH